MIFCPYYVNGDILFRKLKEVLTTIREENRTLSEKAGGIRSSEESLDGLCENPLIHGVENTRFTGCVCAVDSGLLSRRLSGYDVVVGRTAGTAFTYEDGMLRETGYLPSKQPTPEVEVASGLDEHESAVFRSIYRLKNEIALAVECLEKFSPELLLIDGSLLPLPNDRPPKSSRLVRNYNELLSLYSTLFDGVMAKKAGLAGVIKDSRSSKLSEMAGINSQDVLFTDALLKEGERTASFPYKSKKEQLDEIKHSEKVRAFYLKPSEHDIPLRIEYLHYKEHEKLPGELLFLSRINRSFAYPSVLIEADMCAALDGSVMDELQDRICSEGLRPLRRYSRPFKRG